MSSRMIFLRICARRRSLMTMGEDRELSDIARFKSALSRRVTTFRSASVSRMLCALRQEISSPISRHNISFK